MLSAAGWPSWDAGGTSIIEGTGVWVAASGSASQGVRRRSGLMVLVCTLEDNDGKYLSVP